MKKRATLDEVKKNETRHMLAGFALWAATFAWGLWGPGGVWADLLGLLASFGAAACLIHAACLNGRAYELRRQAKERAVLSAAGYKLALLRVEHGGNTVHEQDKGQG